MERLKNDFTAIRFDAETKDIAGSDTTDFYNGTSFYTQSKRGITKAWAALKESFTEDMTMYQAVKVLEQNGIKYRTYCAID